MDSALRLCKMSSTNASKGRNWTSISGLDNNTLDNCYIGVGPHRNQGPSDPLPTAPKGARTHQTATISEGRLRWLLVRDLNPRILAERNLERSAWRFIKIKKGRAQAVRAMGDYGMSCSWRKAVLRRRQDGARRAGRFFGSMRLGINENARVEHALRI